MTSVARKQKANFSYITTSYVDDELCRKGQVKKGVSENACLNKIFYARRCAHTSLKSFIFMWLSETMNKSSFYESMLRDLILLALTQISPKDFLWEDSLVYRRDLASSKVSTTNYPNNEFAINIPSKVKLVGSGREFRKLLPRKIALLAESNAKHECFI